MTERRFEARAGIRPDTRPENRAETRAVRAGVAVNREHGSVIPPIHLSSTFSFKGLGEQRQYDYTRSGNPTRDILGKALAELEGGHDAVITASGMAAGHDGASVARTGRSDRGTPRLLRGDSSAPHQLRSQRPFPTRARRSDGREPPGPSLRGQAQHGLGGDSEQSAAPGGRHRRHRRAGARRGRLRGRRQHIPFTGPSATHRTGR